MMVVELIAGLSYRWVLKPLLFLCDPEKVHDLTVSFGEKLGNSGTARSIVNNFFNYKHPKLKKRLLGIDFSNPMGLAAGFDKNARLTQFLPNFGFGFEEVGSITSLSCIGNPKPRLDRLPKSRGLVVNYGLCNSGADAILSRLVSLKYEFPLGISIAKTNSPETITKEDGIEDYKTCFEKVLKSKVGDYITVNISCPNAYGREPFSMPENLNDLLAALSLVPRIKPVFVKIPADINQQELSELLVICRKYSMNGVIISNLTKDRKSKVINQEEIKDVIPKGGISGKPTFEKSNELIRFAYKNFGKELVIMGCGGVFCAEDAYRKIRIGASLIQLITGLIFQGPQLVCEINRGLVKFLERDGFANISEAVGIDS